MRAAARSPTPEAPAKAHTTPTPPRQGPRPAARPRWRWASRHSSTAEAGGCGHRRRFIAAAADRAPRHLVAPCPRRAPFGCRSMNSRTAHDAARPPQASQGAVASKPTVIEQRMPEATTGADSSRLPPIAPSGDRRTLAHPGAPHHPARSRERRHNARWLRFATPLAACAP